MSTILESYKGLLAAVELLTQLELEGEVNQQAVEKLQPAIEFFETIINKATDRNF